MDNKVIRVVAAVIERDGRYLLTQRKVGAVLPLLWEFPGGRVEADETEEDALRREVLHRVGAEIEVSGKMGENTHEYQGYSVHITLFACTLIGDVEPTPKNVNEIAWPKSTELEKYEFPPADQVTMNRLLGISN